MIAYGCNSNVKFKHMPSKHAEVDAITKVKYWKNRPKNIDLLVVRLTKSGQLAESRPCFDCIEFIEKTGINVKNVYYSTCDRVIVKENFKHMKNNPITYVSSGVRNGLIRKDN
jgi:hypothetical protein